MILKNYCCENFELVVDEIFRLVIELINNSPADCRDGNIDAVELIAKLEALRDE